MENISYRSSHDDYELSVNVIKSVSDAQAYVNIRSFHVNFHMIDIELPNIHTTGMITQVASRLTHSRCVHPKIPISFDAADMCLSDDLP